MIAAVADCFSALKSSRKKSPDCVFNKLGDLPILGSSESAGSVTSHAVVFSLTAGGNLSADDFEW